MSSGYDIRIRETIVAELLGRVADGLEGVFTKLQEAARTIGQRDKSNIRDVALSVLWKLRQIGLDKASVE
jgi:hypothetical protein